MENSSAVRLIDYRNVTINQQEVCILDGINFHLDAGEFVYLIGKVGSGKTSLLKTFYAELEVQEGEATVLGYNMRTIKRKHIPTLRRKLGIVFQDFQLLIDRTVTENLDFVLRATGWKDKQARVNRITEVLELVGMSTKGYKLPHQLLGGEQQRIVIARAILNNPQIILADEPTAALDFTTGQGVLKVIEKVVKERKTTVIMVTHNVEIAKMADRVIKLKNGLISSIRTNFHPLRAEDLNW